MRLEIFLASLLILGGVAAAAVREPASRVTAAIENSMPHQHVHVLANGGGMMPVCRKALAVKWLGSSPHSYRTAQVSCAVPAWTIYAGVDIVRFETVLVATKMIPIGGLIGSDDTRQRVMKASQISGKPLTIRLLSSHLHANQPITAGRAVLTSMVNIPVPIRSGQKVSLVIISRDITVSTSGIALQDGSVGEKIEVENTRSRKKFSARVIEATPTTAGIFVLASE